LRFIPHRQLISISISPFSISLTDIKKFFRWKNYIRMDILYHMKNPDTSNIEARNCPNCGAAAASNSPVCAYCGSQLYARICAVCFSAVGNGMNHCPQCGAAMKPEYAAENQNVLKCPACASKLETREAGNRPLYACPQCGGIWLDHDSFELICYRVEKQILELDNKLPDSKVSPAGKSRRAYVPCPECGKIMTPKNFGRCSGIIVDCCKKHGNWFDWQELHQVVAFIQKGGMQKSLKLEVERAREDARRERDSLYLSSEMKKFLSNRWRQETG
jgi:Zn-finger nucleic acid-binding protein